MLPPTTVADAGDGDDRDRRFAPAGSSGEPPDPGAAGTPITGHGIEVTAAVEKASNYYKKQQPKNRSAERKIHAAVASAEKAHGKHVRDESDAEAAAQEHADAVENRRTSPKLGNRPGRRLGTIPYIVGVVAFVLLERLIDTTILYSFGLPSALTFWLGILFPATKAVAAHLAGRYFRDDADAISPLVEISAAERALGLGAFWVGLLLCVATGILRALTSGLLGFFVFGGVAVVLYLALTYASYLHHSPEDAAVENKASRDRRAAKKANKANATFKRKDRNVDGTIRGRQVLAQHHVDIFDGGTEAATFNYQRRTGTPHAPVVDPLWVAAERRLAAGDIPADFLPTYRRRPTAAADTVDNVLELPAPEDRDIS